MFPFFDDYVGITCCTCGLTFRVPPAWHKDRSAKRDVFRCPNGHELQFQGPTEAERLKRTLETTEAELQSARERADRAERRRRAAQGQVTKLRRRAGGEG